jgi:predicted naringenin-chalcone synthase
MSWKVGDHGFEMKLTSEVGEAIENALSGWLTSWLAAYDLNMGDIDFWGVHPGGPKILSAVQSSLKLDERHLQTSRSVLRHYGNMSSPTVLFILNEFMSQHAEMPKARPANCVLLAFGPGLVAEIALIQAT